MFAAHVKIDTQKDLSTAGTQVESTASALWGLLNGSGPEEQNNSQDYGQQDARGKSASDTDSSDDSDDSLLEQDDNFDSAIESDDSGADGPSINAAAVVPIDITLQLVSQQRTGTTSLTQLTCTSLTNHW